MYRLDRQRAAASSRVMSRWLFNALLSIATATFIALLVPLPLALARQHVFVLGDLRAFYCSARVSLAGFDPYRAEPIGDCERSSVETLRGNFVIPAPLPGHAIKLMQPLAKLAFPVAALIWCGILGLVFFALSGLTTRLTAWPYSYTLVAYLPLAFMIPINQGQLVPVAVALLVAATLALRSNHDRSAAILAAVATIEPHIGLPVCVALFIGRPRARATLVLAALGALLLSAQAVGWSGILEYVQRVLPEHIASEARYDDQYSLTYLLTWLRIPVTLAITLGQGSYWLLAAASGGAALHLRRASGDIRWLVFLPMAASVAGGPYVHEEHLLAVVPLAILLAATAPPKLRAVATIGLALVALPEKFVLERFAVRGVVMHIDTQSSAQPVGTLPVLADAAWAMRIAEHAGHLPLLWAKVPSWIGLIILGTLIVARSRSRSCRLPAPDCRRDTRAESKLALSEKT